MYKLCLIIYDIYNYSCMFLYFYYIKTIIELPWFIMAEYNIGIHFLKISENVSGQRIDNFLKIYLKSVPISMIYRIIRIGKIRVNKKKVNFFYRLKTGDLLTVPSVHSVKVHQISVCSKKDEMLLQKSLIYEDDDILVLNKPPGIAVHGGSGLKFNIIDGLRRIFFSKTKFLELVHRLDRDTSGVLLFAKNRITLTCLQKQWSLQTIQKEYLAVVIGLWDSCITTVSISVLKKRLCADKNVSEMHCTGVKNKKNSKTCFKIKEYFSNLATLLIINPVTGRTHQIRAHTQYAKHPIIGDRMYGNYQINVKFKKLGLDRLFLHASKLSFVHPNTNEIFSICAPVDQSFDDCLFFLRKFNNKKFLQLYNDIKMYL